VRASVSKRTFIVLTGHNTKLKEEGAYLAPESLRQLNDIVNGPETPGGIIKSLQSIYDEVLSCG
jgi:hypothetical protein